MNALRDVYLRFRGFFCAGCGRPSRPLYCGQECQDRAAAYYEAAFGRPITEA